MIDNNTILSDKQELNTGSNNSTNTLTFQTNNEHSNVEVKFKVVCSGDFAGTGSLTINIVLGEDESFSEKREITILKSKTLNDIKLGDVIYDNYIPKRIKFQFLKLTYSISGTYGSPKGKVSAFYYI